MSRCQRRREAIEIMEGKEETNKHVRIMNLEMMPSLPTNNGDV